MRLALCVLVAILWGLATAANAQFTGAHFPAYPGFSPISRVSIPPGAIGLEINCWGGSLPDHAFIALSADLDGFANSSYQFEFVPSAHTSPWIRVEIAYPYPLWPQTARMRVALTYKSPPVGEYWVGVQSADRTWHIALWGTDADIFASFGDWRQFAIGQWWTDNGRLWIDPWIPSLRAGPGR